MSSLGLDSVGGGVNGFEQLSCDRLLEVVIRQDALVQELQQTVASLQALLTAS